MRTSESRAGFALLHRKTKLNSVPQRSSLHTEKFIWTPYLFSVPAKDEGSTLEPVRDLFSHAVCQHCLLRCR